MTFKKRIGEQTFRLTKYKSEHSHHLSDPVEYNGGKFLDGRCGPRSGYRTKGGQEDMTSYFMSKIKNLETDLVKNCNSAVK